jgi:hypothetical protein
MHDCTMASWSGISKKLDDLYETTGAKVVVDSAFALEHCQSVYKSYQSNIEPSIAPQQLVSAGYFVDIVSAGYFVDIALTNPAISLSVGIDGRERSLLRNMWINNCCPNHSQRERQPAIIVM